MRAAQRFDLSVELFDRRKRRFHLRGKCLDSKRRVAFAVLSALGLGALRLVIGLIVGQAIFYSASPAYLLPSMRLTDEALRSSYFAIYIPVRFVEWLVVTLIILATTHQLSGSTSMMNKHNLYLVALLWVVGGVLLSCLLDVPMIGIERSFSR